MVATESFQVWGSRAASLVAIGCTCFGLSSLNDLPRSTIGYYYILALLTAGVILSLMMMFAAGAYDPSESYPGSMSYEILKYSTILSHTFSWIFIPISAAVTAFYMKQEDKFSIRNFISNEQDLAFISIATGLIIIGMDHIDRCIILSFFPTLMLVACVIHENGFGIAAAFLSIVNTIFSESIKKILFPSSGQQLDRSILFQINYRAMALILLMAGTVMIMTEMKTVSMFNFFWPFTALRDTFTSRTGSIWK